MVIIAEMLGWGATISVNALIGMHFLEVRDFEFDFIANEYPAGIDRNYDGTGPELVL